MLVSIKPCKESSDNDIKHDQDKQAKRDIHTHLINGVCEYLGFKNCEVKLCENL